ncbi:uncharacterized protein LOC108326656 [Vigna angularis]|uniref:uncharacterized protein LOC108326656 n=1 Tax=Phaseolus angularis TaxID=3914 RepID=UPI000809EA47|nr:uncharacterized protein LOC108326656 [Vigna angularis]
MTVDAARTRPLGRNDDEDAAAARTWRRERNGDEDTVVTEGGDGGQICALGGAEGRSGRMEGQRADMRVWRGGGHICAYRGAEGRFVTSGEPPEDGGFVEGGGAEEVSDGSEEGGDGRGYEHSGGQRLGGGS